MERRETNLGTVAAIQVKDAHSQNGWGWGRKCQKVNRPEGCLAVHSDWGGVSKNVFHSSSLYSWLGEDAAHGDGELACLPR